MTTIDSESFRQVLLEKRQRVAHALEYLHRENPGSLEDEAVEFSRGADNHLADTATVTFDRELDYTLEEVDEQVLAAIDGALKRIDEGTFGTCVNCGNPIPEERLRAIPYATLCIDCKRRAERG